MGTEPEVWREFLIRDDATFSDLHEAMQAAFEWDCAHLWEFREPEDDRGRRVITGKKGLAPDTMFDSGATDYAPPGSLLVRDFFLKNSELTKRSCIYLYDFGDNWEHLIECVGTEPVEEGDDVFRRLVGGAHPAPPEDCGGLPGFERLLAIKRTGEDPWGEDVEEIARWYKLGELEFDLDAERYYFALSAGTPAETLLEIARAHIEREMPELDDQLLHVLDVLCDTSSLLLPADERPSSLALAMAAWEMYLTEGAPTPRKPEIYAGALFYVVNQRLSLDPRSQKAIAETFGTSATSIRQESKALDALFDDIGLAVIAFVALSIFGAATPKLIELLSQQIPAKMYADIIWDKDAIDVDSVRSLPQEEQPYILLVEQAHHSDPDGPTHLFMALRTTPEFTEEERLIVPWFGKLPNATRREAIGKFALMAMCQPTHGRPARPNGMIIGDERDAQVVREIVEPLGVSVVSTATLDRKARALGLTPPSSMYETSPSKGATKKKKKKKKKKKTSRRHKRK